MSAGYLSTAIGFKKVRLLLRSLTIIPEDLNFVTAKHHVRFGSGKICGIENNTSCIGADAMIDLRGTPFKIKVFMF